MENNKKPKKSGKGKIFGISFLILAAVLAVLFVIILKLNRENSLYVRDAASSVSEVSEEISSVEEESEYSESSESEPLPESVGDPKLKTVLSPSIEVDFNALNAVNSDVYGWIHIDGTQVSYPVYQSDPENPDYYLKTDPITHTETMEGAIFSESNYNPDPLGDPVTVVYGHNLPGFDTMFTGLHGYSDESFRSEHPYIEFYTEDGRVRYYKPMAALNYDNSLILAKYDFTTREGYQAFLDSLDTTHWDPTWIDSDWQRSTDNRLLICSTCNGITHDQRFIVCAVQVDYNGDPVYSDLYQESEDPTATDGDIATDGDTATGGDI